MKKPIHLLLVSCFVIFIPTFADALRIDQLISDFCVPMADAWEACVLTAILITRDISVPIVLLFLFFGAAYFTVYFRFVNTRRFPLALRVVQGKYDFIEKNDADTYR